MQIDHIAGMYGSRLEIAATPFHLVPCVHKRHTVTSVESGTNLDLNVYLLCARRNSSSLRVIHVTGGRLKEDRNHRRLFAGSWG